MPSSSPPTVTERALPRLLPACAALLLALPVLASERLEGSARAVGGDKVILRGTRVTLLDLAIPDGVPGRSALAALLEGRTVACTREHKVGHASYQGRCRLDDGRDLAEALVRSGWARAAGPTYADAEAEARAAGRGIWADEN